jgi:hypothetical protein
MDTQQPLTDFQSFDDLDTASYMLLGTLEENNIPYEISGTNSESDFIKGKASWLHKVVVKIPPGYFDTVNDLLEEKARAFPIPQRHYLLSFTDDELMEILEQPDKWGRDDYSIARKLMAQRGKEVPQAELTKLKTERLNSLAKPETVDPRWLGAGFAGAVLGGIIAVFFGRIICTSKKTLPNGQRVFTYDAESRKKAFVIYITGIISFIFWLVLGLIKAAGGKFSSEGGHLWF